MSSDKRPSEIDAAWDRYSVDRERTTFSTANLLVCVLVPVWSLFDFYLEPALALRFLALRAADVAVTLVLWRLIARSRDSTRSRAAMVASIVAVGLAIVAMLAQVGPAHYALYAFGFSLVFWGAGLLLSWPLSYGAGAFAGLIVAHVVAYAIARPVPLADFIGALFYLVSGAVVAMAQLAVRRRLERAAFDASFELEARNAQMASTVSALAATQARLSASSAALAESLDVATTAECVVGIAVPAFASWATLTVAGANGTVVRVAAHADAAVAASLRKAVHETELPSRAVPRAAERIDHANREDVARVAGVRVSEISNARSLFASPLVAHGHEIGTLVLGRTDRSYDESEIAFAEEIARRAALALDNARLYAVQQSARDAADAANHAKDQFLASVSHELRTPLSAILGWAKIVSLPGLAEEKRARAMETIERNAVAMVQLIEDLIDVSRIVSGKFRLDLRGVEPAAVVEAAIESVRPAAEAKRIRISQQLDRTVGPIRGDSGRLQQVVWNLVSNAVKFTPAGGHVDVDLRARDAHAEIVVRDTGKGIEPRFLAHVFEPFRQADALVTQPTSGLGLGLAIVKRIVELHGGDAHAFSDGPGRGATFTVRLPLTAEREAGPTSSSERRGFQSPPQLEGLRVLVVEDEPDMRRFLEEVLTACGSRVVGTSSVSEAMDRFEIGEIPDVIISDIGMAGESGYDLIRRVRERSVGEGGRVPAAALTAYTRAEDRRRVLGAGFELHIAKPVEPAELVSAVATLAKFVDER